MNRKEEIFDKLETRGWVKMKMSPQMDDLIRISKSIGQVYLHTLMDI